MKTYKVLHLPTSVGGNSHGLCQAERGVGLDSDLLIMDHHPFYGQSRDSDTITKSRAWFNRCSAFLSVRRKYDVFHFNFGQSLLHFPRFDCLSQFDLRFYPTNAKLFVTYNGCDARQKYPTMQRTPIAPCHNSACYGGMCNSGELDRRRRVGIEKMAYYCQHIWALNPDLLHFLPKGKASFLPYTVYEHDQTIALPRLDSKLRIVHAPTNRVCKGTDFVLGALRRIELEFPGLIEVYLVENMPHKQALDIYRSADLVIDQVLIGWYGAVAAEAMLMGKPVLARISREDLKFVPGQMAEDVDDTVIHADPSNIYEVLCDLVHNRNRLMLCAQASLEYARRWHSPAYVAGITRSYYER